MTAAPAAETSVDFASLGLDAALLACVAARGFTAPTAIQARAIPELLAGHDVFGQAATGTGKTAAFGLPMLHHLLRAPRRGPAPRGLVLAPTRELAIQVAEALTSIAGDARLRVVAVYGGQPIFTQIRELRRGADVVVATPGRLVDHLQRRSVDLGEVAHVVLDEADEMLDMGFADDLEAILGTLPQERQTALFSATLPPRLAALAGRQMRDPVRIRVERPAASATAPQVEQRAHIVSLPHKPAALARILLVEGPSAGIVFCRTRGDVDRLTETLTRVGLPGEALHGGIAQDQRDRVMQRFRAGTTALLVATDVAARGLDISHVTHVVNYDIPADAETYVHRIGRTGRAGRSGVAITLCKPNERRHLQAFGRATNGRLEVLPVPDGAALQASCMARAAAALRTALASPQLAAYAAAAAALVAEHDAADVAAAALLIADNGAALQAAEHIPVHAGPSERDARGRRPERTGAERPRNERRAHRGGDGEVAQLFVGAGHSSGIRAGDLVGALANELDLDARAIGAITIQDRFSLVEVPAAIADEIVDGMRGSHIKGRSVVIRRERARA